jgi:non-ribosomal peptide synthase protein (TIGR01720 family)
MVKLPFKTTSFKYWAEKLLDHAKSEEIQQELNYWLTMSNSDFSPIPVDYPEGANIEHSAEIVSASLSVEETNTLLHDVPSIYRTQINDVLLTAIVQSFKDWTGRNSVLVELEGHGREDLFDNVDISRTLGWFTTMFPVILELEEAFSPGEALKSIKEQLRRIPDRGIGYGVLKYLCPNKKNIEQLKSLPASEVNFNYLGQFDQAIMSHSSILSPAQESRGPERSPQGYRSHILEISGSVMNGQLQMVWIYSKNIHKHETIEKLADSFTERLRSIIRHCQSTDEIGFSATDFKDFQWSQDDIDDIVGEITHLEG